jgi:hypothetical protein
MPSQPTTPTLKKPEIRGRLSDVLTARRMTIIKKSVGYSIHIFVLSEAISSS